MTTIHQDQARQWLEKFLDGMTSNEEEAALYAFFASDEVPKDLRKYKKMFAWYAGKMQGELPHRAKTRHKIMRDLSIAASILLLAGVGFGVQKHIERKKSTKVMRAVIFFITEKRLPISGKSFLAFRLRKAR